MVTKTYGIDGVVEFSFLFRAGKGTLRAEFSGGVLDPKRKRPAVLTTSNMVAQLIIENSTPFKFGQIYLINTSVIADKISAKEAKELKVKYGKAPKATDKTAVTSVKINEETGMKIYDKVTTIGEAVNVLVELGATAESLKDVESVLITAGELSVNFPNLSLK